MATMLQSVVDQFREAPWRFEGDIVVRLFLGWNPRSPSLGVLLPTFLGEGSPTKIDYRKKVGTLIRTSLLEDLVSIFGFKGQPEGH